MLQGVRLPKDQLVARYRVSERLAVRVGALLGRGVEVSGALLETASPGSPAESLLLLPEILASADRLATADLVRLSKTVPGGDSIPGLVVAAAEDRRVVALGEEVLAESAWTSPAAGGGALREVTPASLLADGGARILGVPGSDAFRPDEAQGLFTPEAVAQLKLTILTGVDPDAKIEAVRKLAFVPLGIEEKGRLCLKALAEEHAGVRREAALLLRTLGIAPEVSETIAGLSEGGVPSRTLALSHLSSLQGRVSPAEQLILLAVLLSVIREEKDPGLAASALGALPAFAPRVTGDADLLDRVLRLLYPLLAGDGPLADPAAGAVVALGRKNLARVGEAVWREIQVAADAPLRRHLLVILARLAAAGDSPPSVHRRDLAAAVARELGQGTDTDALCRQLAVEAIALGADAAGALVEAFPAARTEQGPFLIKLLDDVVTADGMPADVRSTAGEFVIRFWKTSGRILRLAILSMRLPVDGALPAGLRREFARCFLADLHDAGFPHIVDATETAVRQMGIDVLPVVREMAGEGAHAAEREAAVRLYALLLRDAQERPGPGGVEALPLEEAVSFLRGLEVGDPDRRGAAVRALGMLLSGPAMSPALVGEVASDFRRRRVRTPAAEDMICALGWIASGPRADPALRVDLLVLIVELLMRAAADAPVTQTQTDEGMRLDFSAHASRQTEFIRELIGAIRRILCAPAAPDGLPPGLRERAVRRLVEKWAAVENYDVVWAPGNVTALAETLGEIAAAPGLPVGLRAGILDALLVAARSIPVIRILGRACAWEGPAADTAGEAPEFGAACRRVAEQFADMLQHADYADPEDQDVLLQALGRIAGAAFLGTAPEEGEPVRRRLVQCLFDGLTHGQRRVREALAALADSPRLPDPLRQDIRERLKGVRDVAKP
jgi:hypothetical protein